MRNHFFTLLLVILCCLLFTCGGCGGGADDFLPDPYSRFFGVVVGDLNDDGFPDIATAMDYYDEGTTFYAAVILNDPSSPGNFFPADVYRIATGCCLNSIASGDINEDGLADIVTENGENIFILFQNSATPGNFLRPQTIFVGEEIEALSIGDLNADGFNDIAISGYKGLHLSILFQDPADSGTWLPLVSFGITSFSGAIADIDGDFINDLAVVGDGKVKLLFQDPAAPGDFLAPVYLNAGAEPTRVKIGDLDKDGCSDLLVANGPSGGSSPGGVSVLLQDAANPGKFFAAVDYSLGCGPQEISLEDLNNDGLLDVAVASWCHGCRIIILLQDISNVGTFLPAILLVLFPDVSWELMYKFAYTSFYLAVPAFLLYMQSIFPKYSKYFLYVILGIAVVLSGTVIYTPVSNILVARSGSQDIDKIADPSFAGLFTMFAKFDAGGVGLL